MPKEDLLRIGVSECLMGASVRYDGGHKRSHTLLDLVAPHVTLVPVCPEVEAGMGTPREPVNLVAGGPHLRMIGARTGTDHTASLDEFAVRGIEELAEANLSGYVFKSGSPSCGLSVPAEGAGEPVEGLWASAVRKAFPHIPVIEEEDLEDPAAREGFFERAYAFKRQMQFFAQPRSVGQLTMSHVQAKLQLEAHRQGSFDELFGLFRRAREMTYEELAAIYLERFMEVLSTPIDTAAHFGALKTAFDALKPLVAPEVAKDLARSLQDFRLGSVPWGVPLSLLRHYLRIHDHPTLNGQTYLDPGPRELLLRTRH